MYEVDLNDPSFTHFNGTYNLTLKEGEELRVVGSENPSNGYLWHYDAPTVDTNTTVVTLEWDTFRLDRLTQSQFQQGLTGFGGVRVMHFEAEAAGNRTLEFVLARPWEFNGFTNLSLSNYTAYYKIDIVVLPDPFE